MQTDKLTVLWMSTDKRAAAEMALCYVRDSLQNGWWSKIDILLWGPTVNTAVSDEIIANELSVAIELGAKVTACVDCAIGYGVEKSLSEAGIDVRGLGRELTALLKSGAPIMLI